MEHATIHKATTTPGTMSGDTGTEADREAFWQRAAQQLDGFADGGLNIAYEAVDRHVEKGFGGKIALCWLGQHGERRTITYADLKQASDRFANALQNAGIGKGDRVYSLLGRIPELYICVLGILKNGSVYSPLFSAFGPDPVRARMEIGEGSALITNTRLYSRKVAPWHHDLPSLKQVFLVDGGAESDLPGTIGLTDTMAEADDTFSCVHTRPDDMALLHFTSGTTGKPKGAMHVHNAVIALAASGRYALDLHKDDIFWCTADPGWVTGTAYGIISPLVSGATIVVDQAEFEAERWYQILQDEKVTVWYTAPTAIRMLMKLGAATAAKYDLSRLRFMASVGEPLNPEAVIWSNKTFGIPFHDNWWQSETGGIMIANTAQMDVKPGSMGKPLPGIEAGIVKEVSDGHITWSESGEVGELALRAGWPSMMRGYLHAEDRYKKCFVDGWYLSGDLAERDGEGYYWFVGRADDMIKSAGHFIGPFEVESVLIAHEAVAEAAVIGIPDPTAGEVVKAYVTLNPGWEGDAALRKDIMIAARKSLGPTVAPREILFRTNLPKTRSGKIMRRLLKARELGLPEGDTSTLESDG